MLYMPRYLLAALVAFGTSALSAAEQYTYVVPVVTAKVKERVYSTTLALRNDGAADVDCQAIYAVPNDPKGGTLRSRYTVPRGGRPQVEEDVLMEVGAVGTMRIVCSGPLAVAARIQASLDGGKTFDEGRTFAGLDEAASFKRLRTVNASSDLLVAEVAGKRVTVEVVVKDADGAIIGRKTYEVPGFAQQIVNLSKLREGSEALHVELHVRSESGGALVVGEETRDPKLLTMAVRLLPESRRAFNEHQARQLAAATAAAQTDRTPSITEQLLLSPFKGAPFRDPMTGLVLMRDRWYDPRTGTFLTPDPEGFHDSSNLYSFGKGDPVNNSDPTGRVVALSGSAAEKQAAYNRLIRVLDNPLAASHFSIGTGHRVQLDMDMEAFTRRFGGRAGQLARMIDSPKVVYLTELMGEIEHPYPIENVFQPQTLEGQTRAAGGGFFRPSEDRKHALAAFDPRLFPRSVADVTETADTVFVHEFFGHGYSWAVPMGWSQSQTGIIREKYLADPPFKGGASPDEPAGLTAENIYRMEHGMRLRTYYLSDPNDWQWPTWIAPYLSAQREADKRAAAAERDRRRRAWFLHNIWEAPGRR
jgi:RHS repeat-associated protein